MCSTELKKLPAVEDAIVAEMEHAAFIYMRRLLADATDDEFESLAPHSKQLFSLHEDTRRGHQWSTRHQQQQGLDWPLENKAVEDQLLRRVAECSSDGAALCAHGESLPSIMRGQTLAIEVLMQANRLNNFYRIRVSNAEV